MASPPHSFDDLNDTVQQILATQQAFQLNLNNLTTEVAHIRTRMGPPGFNHFGPENHNTHHKHHPFAPSSIKLDIPRFDGSNPLNWIFKINQFFEFHRTPEDQRLRLASFYIEGEALTWFQWMHANHQLLT